MTEALVIGAGPAGLMAAEQLALSGRRVLVADSKPSVARKLLMAGKSGLNLTKDEPFDQFISHYGPSATHLLPMLSDFGPEQVKTWAKGLDQSLFTGSTGRVFPKAMKASPLLRAWLARLAQLNVDVRTRWNWQGWQENMVLFETPEGTRQMTPGVTVLACGGASWARLGSDGAWAAQFSQMDLNPFLPANMGFRIDWSPHMQRHFGAPVKGVRICANGSQSRGEFVITKSGIEGGGIYAVSCALRDGAPLTLDLMPDVSLEQVRRRLSRPRGKASLTNHLRKCLGLDPVKNALLMECARPLPDDLAAPVKSLPVRHHGPGSLDQAISTAGGLRFDALDDSLMLRSRPGVFAAGEMLDWEAPTGGYLLTACLATGHWAGQKASAHLDAI